MKVNSFKRLACVLLACLMCFGIFGTPTSAASGNTGASAAALEEAKQYLNSDTYATYLATYLNAGIGAGDTRYKAEFDAKASDDSAYVISDSAWADKETGYGTVENYRAGAVYSPGDGSVVFTVDVATTGMYYIMVEYYTLGETVNAIERKLYIDGELPFKEASLLSLSKIWEYQYNGKKGDDGFDEDLNGNSLTPTILQKSDWRTYFCHDADGYSNEYFSIYFSEGTHEVEFRGIRESMVIGSVTLVPVNDSECGVLSYAEYLAYVTGTLGATNAPAGSKVLLQAEKPVFVSDSSVVMSGNKTSAINQPTSPSCDLYNVIGATSYNAVGQWAAYTFDVPETGLYNFTLRYLQNTLDGVFVSRAIKLTSHGQGSFVYGLADGTPTVPFQEAYSSRYVYSDDWMVDRAGDAANDFKFYFEKGVTYTVYFEVSLGALAGQLQRVENVLSILNSAYLEILKLTGPNPDEYSNYNFFALLPDLKYDLSFAAVELDDIRQELENICGEGTGAHLANLENIIRLVSTMAESEFEIAGNFANLKSYLGTLGTWISDSKKSTLIVDFITVQSPDASLEKANANFFQTVWYEIRAFFASFFTNYDQMGVTTQDALSEDALTVWHASGRDQTRVIRNLIDTYFADYCAANNFGQVPVSLKLVSGGSLLPSILAGSGPDIYLGVDSGTIINYAIREAVVSVNEVTTAEERAEIMSRFDDAAVQSISLHVDGEYMTYGVPQTMSFAMMFYRIDSLVELNADVPETWDDLMNLLPALQANNMEVGLSYGLALDFFLYQMGGNMWRYTEDPASPYAGAKIGLDTNEGFAAFEYCASLYTEYSFPVSFDSANRFRTGEMPIIVQDYVGGYNVLIVYATELNGLWSFSKIPGTVRTDENGDEYADHTAIIGVSSSIIPFNKTRPKQKLENAWKYMSWCSGAKYSSEYANRMVSILGPSAKHGAANLEAMKDMSWTSQELDAIYEQIEWLDAIIPYPGSYIINRYVSFAFLAAVNDGADAVDSLRSYIDIINDEITRKRQEFDMAVGDPPQAD